jgi:hypothetical protein
METVYFKIPFDLYEKVRKEMDIRSGFPNEFASTWFAPGSEALIDILDRDCIFATSVSEIVAEFLKYSEAQVLTKETYDLMIKEFLF